jgi:hypothetical protein
MQAVNEPLKDWVCTQILWQFLKTEKDKLNKWHFVENKAEII